ncbi:putative Alpha-2-macroglobulin-like protein 1 [Hypsibius exemplaris]|uniref:Alpha-2-macroglobulin-like protein 1 n=1 Tax=Hypsibius exemplaris TaxID=2072580 RepID=A0A9X6NL65_HYPEX|nr:putative Alpha-2-macroglobulin-like protein 1 [Hypsibius exemplaris]
MERSIEVRAEGITREGRLSPWSIVSVELSPFRLMFRSVVDFVDGTLKLKFAVYGGEWTPVVTTLTTSGKELDGLIQLPSGCGEQNMAKLMPNIYVAHYLEKMGVLGQRKHWEKKLRYNIERGYEHQFDYQLDNGSFSAWGKQQKDVPGSTWLTAFVLRGFSEGRQAANGSFVEKGFLIEREKAGFACRKGAASEQRFVALAFVEARSHWKLALDQGPQNTYCLFGPTNRALSSTQANSDVMRLRQS